MGFENGPPTNRPASWFNWDEAAVARLRELAATGMAASAIADELGCGSRCAVIGKLNRLRRADFAAGVAPMPRPARGRHTSSPRPRPSKRKAAPMATPAPIQPPPPPEPPPGPVTLLELGEFSCRWIVNDDLTHALYCGQTRDPASWGCYCPDHRRRAYAQSSPPRRQYFR